MAEGLPSGSPIDREIAVAPTDTDVALPYRVGHLAAELRPGICLLYTSDAADE